MTHDELLAEIIGEGDGEIVKSTRRWNNTKALRAVVELHKPYDSKDTPHEVAMGWCKGCAIEYNRNEYASQPYPCPTIQAIEKELQ